MPASQQLVGNLVLQKQLSAAGHQDDESTQATSCSALAPSEVSRAFMMESNIFNVFPLHAQPAVSAGVYTSAG